MSSKIKGSDGAALMTVTEAAEVLQCSSKTVYNMAQRGFLKTIYVEDPDTGRSIAHFREEDVYAAATAKLEEMTLPRAGNLAMRALAIAEANQKSVQALMDILGFHKGVIPFDDVGVSALQAEAKELLHASLPATEGTILHWSRVLMQLTEEYLDLARSVTGDPEPWKVFTLLGERLAEDIQQGVGTNNEKTRLFLSGARRHFRNTAYFYVRTKGGAAFAEEKVSKGDKLDETIINLMFVH